MNNQRIASTFETLADLLEFKGENPFRLRAYRNAARAIKDLSEPVSEILKDQDRKLTDIEGIGKAVAEKSAVLVETGRLPQLDELTKEIPESVLALLRVPNLGPKKAAVLFNEKGIQTLEQLKAACEAEELRTIKGFGAKSEEAILKGIEIAAAAEKRIYWAKADELVLQLQDHLQEVPGIERLKFAGSYRRGKETVGDLDILVVAQDSQPAMDRLAEFAELDSVIGRGDTKMSIRLQSGFQIDMRVVPQESFGAALQYFTGSKEHNVVIRGKAKTLGLKVNEWGVFKVEDDSYVAGETEESVYEALGYPWIPPELRESRREFEWADSELPSLLEEQDLVADLHMHTTATDGKASLEEMIDEAKRKGLQYIAITDHSKRVSMANGLDSERLLAQWAEIDRFNEAAEDGFRVLKGIECDILEAGGMDLPDDVLAQADWVLASVHYGQQQPRQQITDRILGALQNEHVDAIAHPTGRLINRREAYEVDLQAVFEAAIEFGKILELNGNPARLDLHDVHCAAAKEAGIPIVINTDAHNTANLGVMRYGVMQARRAGLSKQDVLNTRPLSEFLKQVGVE